MRKVYPVFLCLFLLLALNAHSTVVVVFPYEVQTEVEMSVQDINKYPMKFRGKQLSLVGEVDGEPNKYSFILDGDKDWYLDEITIVSTQPLNSTISVAELKDGDKVTVKGKLQTMELFEIDSGYGMDLDPELSIELEGVDHYIQASSISIHQGERK